MLVASLMGVPRFGTARADETTQDTPTVCTLQQVANSVYEEWLSSATGSGRFELLLYGIFCQGVGVTAGFWDYLDIVGTVGPAAEGCLGGLIAETGSATDIAGYQRNTGAYVSGGACQGVCVSGLGDHQWM